VKCHTRTNPPVNTGVTNGATQIQQVTPDSTKAACGIWSIIGLNKA
jgi:hypothetical protein